VQKNTKDQITYFIYNLRLHSTIRDKLEVSVTYTQIEVSTFSQFLTLPHSFYGHLVTDITCVQLWSDTATFGLHLRPADNITWGPSLIHPNDRSIMEIATSVYDKKGSAIINRCCIYLQLISMVDLLISNTQTIHPAYYEGVFAPSRHSDILWPPIPWPPKNYWQLWSHFLRYHISPFLQMNIIDWTVVHTM
jgi:hypothetical protein